MTAVLLSTTLVIAAAGQKPNELDTKVAKAREKGIEFLKKQQKEDGTWSDGTNNMLADMEGGITALATLAMLEAGVPADDKAIDKAVAYLVKLELKKTYVVSLQTQVLARVDAKKHKELIQKCADWLIEKAVKDGDKISGWSYPGGQMGDGSNTHFAVMGLHAAAQSGAKVDAKHWQQIRDAYVSSQSKNGWGYYANRDSTGDRATLSMTTCGLLGLIIAQKYDKNAKEPHPAVEKGMTALFDLAAGNRSVAYEWMATAELGRALGTTEFKLGKQAKAWYREGAEKLVREQREDGLWVGQRGLDGMPVYATACALYFLGPPAKK
jgi:squalene cyclase